MTHDNDKRIDELYKLIWNQRKIDGLHPYCDPNSKKPSMKLRALRKERFLLCFDRWSDLVTTYGDPRKPGWPKSHEWRGQPVAFEREANRRTLKLTHHF
jgi:hypothetical protein